jgi:translation initiation factor 1
MGPMAAEDDVRLVFSTERGRVREERPRPAAGDPGEGDGVVRVSRTKTGRKGKTVTLVSGLPPGDREPVARELKRLCGSGGAVKDGLVEIQGDHRERILAHLTGRYRVKLAGG